MDSYKGMYDLYINFHITLPKCQTTKTNPSLWSVLSVQRQRIVRLARNVNSSPIVRKIVNEKVSGDEAKSFHFIQQSPIVLYSPLTSVLAYRLAYPQALMQTGPPPTLQHLDSPKRLFFCWITEEDCVCDVD